jgi:CheY-like chemotaxis protein
VSTPQLQTGDPAKILLVDDRRENLIALEAMLQGLPVQSVPVVSGEQALKKLLVEDFALILLDAQMPTMDGFETARHIKRRERTRHVPIIFLTAGDNDTHLALRGYQAGAVDYLVKPFDVWILRAKVSVFVELWEKTKESAAHAEMNRQHDSVLRRACAGLDEATALLRTALLADEPTARSQVEHAVEALVRIRSEIG